MLKKIIFLDHKKYFLNLNNSQRLGLLILSSIILFNKWTWLWFFDSDGVLSFSASQKFFFFDLLLFTLGISLFALKIKINFKRTFKIIAYLLYVVFIFEFFSFLTLKIILSNENMKDRIDFSLGNLKKPSSNISWMTSDLRSDYRLSKYSTKSNIHGFRFGGGKKLQNKIRILCLGGSTTWGDGVKDSEDTYPAVLQSYLEEKGYNVDVINGGVPYYTSLEVLMRYITFGIFTKPDIVLLHTGGNDIGPFCSPYDYKPDYSHWRSSGNYNKDKIFKELWNDFPSSFIRIFLIRYFKPGEGSRLAIQTSQPHEEMIAKTNLTMERTMGLQNYFKSIISISKSENILPITILFNSDQNRKQSIAGKYYKGDLLKYAVKRCAKAISINNTIMDSISLKNNLNIIPFNEFKPSSEDMWIDHCHLNKEGIKEKAIFIGDFIIKNNIFDNLIIDN